MSRISRFTEIEYSMKRGGVIVACRTQSSDPQFNDEGSRFIYFSPSACLEATALASVGTCKYSSESVRREPS